MMIKKIIKLTRRYLFDRKNYITEACIFGPLYLKLIMCNKSKEF